MAPYKVAHQSEHLTCFQRENSLNQINGASYQEPKNTIFEFLQWLCARYFCFGKSMERPARRGIFRKKRSISASIFSELFCDLSAGVLRVLLCSRGQEGEYG